MQLKWIPTEKKRFLPLLLLGDEQESMIDRYLMRGTMYAAYDGETAAGVMVFVRLSQDVYELKNLAVAPAYQGKGVGKWMVQNLCAMCRVRGAAGRVRARWGFTSAAALPNAAGRPGSSRGITTIRLWRTA